ncbi:unnamed protein product [Arabis nemorensis]|uniref:Secreted protein n=1 Tax=Arabis nemorensis TaxID=586526 RepID=A0A565AXC3_9BRAS|nr:unnamed protein product [Arabis nemorensis]
MACIVSGFMALRLSLLFVAVASHPTAGSKVFNVQNIMVLNATAKLIMPMESLMFRSKI